MVIGARRTDTLPRVSKDTLIGAKTNLADELVGMDRLVCLGSCVLWEAIDTILATQKIGLVVCAPSESDEPELADKGNALLAALATDAQLSLSPRASRVFAAGRSAIFEALPFAVSVLAQPDVAAVCLLGIDSLVTRPRLRRALEQGATFGNGVLAPGEAAAAVVFTRRPQPDSVALLSGVGFADEPSVKNGQKNTGQGLQSAIANAVVDAGVSRASFAGLVHDGSAKAAEELAWAKSNPLFANSPNLSLLAPSITTGDSGAAAGVVSLAAAAFLIEKSFWPGTTLCCFSDNHMRGAVVLNPLSAPTHLR
jgi:hypothetical protein